MLIFTRILTILIIFSLLTQADEDAAWWSDSFSEERGGFSEFRGYAITGMKCDGKRCDNKSLFFEKELVLAGGMYEVSEKHSDEQGRFDCPAGTVMAGMRCGGDWCNNLWYYCQKPGNFRLKSNTNNVFFDGSGTKWCPQHYVLTGMECHNSHCGIPEMHCTEIDRAYYISDSKEDECTKILTEAECMAAATENSGEWTWDGTRDWDDRLPGCLYTVSGGDINYNTNSNGQGINSNWRTICHLNKDYAAPSWPSETGPCHWSNWFSEEGSNNFAPVLNQAIIAVQCRGDYCDDLRVYYCKSLFTSHTDIVQGNKFSDEDSVETCPHGRIVTGLKCYGAHCDDMRLDCSEPNESVLRNFNDTDPTHETDWFSEEGIGMAQCDDGYVVYGMDCKGKRCDNIKLHCRKYKFIEGRSLSYKCDDETGECVGYGPFIGSWVQVASGGNHEFTSGWSKSDTETISIEEAQSYTESFTIGAEMSYCAGGSSGLQDFEACYSLSFGYTSAMSFSTVFGQEYTQDVTTVNEKTCTPNIPQGCVDAGAGCTLYQWQTQASTSDGQETIHTTCIHWAKYEGTISEPPNCLPNFCWDNVCSNCLAVRDGTQTIIDPTKGIMKDTDSLDNYVGCHENVEVTDPVVSYIGLKSKDWDSLYQCDIACTYNQFWFIIENTEDPNSDDVHCYCATRTLGTSSSVESCDAHRVKDPNSHLSLFWDDHFYAFYATTNYQMSSSSTANGSVHRNRRKL